MMWQYVIIWWRDDYKRPQEGVPSEYRWNMVGRIPENVDMVFRLLIYVIWLFLDALASLKTMFKIKSFSDVFKISWLQKEKAVCA